MKFFFHSYASTMRKTTMLIFGYPKGVFMSRNTQKVGNIRRCFDVARQALHQKVPAALIQLSRFLLKTRHFGHVWYEIGDFW